MDNNVILYSGKVTLFYKDQKGKYKISKFSNEGKMPLFTFLTAALQGQLKTELKPQYLMGIWCDKDNESSPSKNGFIQKVGVAKSPTRKNSGKPNDINAIDSDSIEYCFSINPGVLIRSVTTINRLQLISNNGEVCAEIDLDNGNEIDAANSCSDILVYWTLKFANANATSASTN